MAAPRPLIAVIEDLHWAEPSMLDLIEYVASWSRDTPIVLLCTTRPELDDRRAGWGAGPFDASTLHLEALTEQESVRLVDVLLDHAELPDGARRTIIDAADGNPLFVEQMVAMLVDDGLLVSERGRWVARGDLTTIAPPPSVMALLDARLERLGDEERASIERASIEGKRFHLGSVRALGPPDAAVSETLMSLVRRELVAPDRSAFAGEDGFRFRHALIRDAAYRRIPKQTRAELHERHADWLEGAAAAGSIELDEVVGFHLEQAVLLRRELGPSDDLSSSLATRAAERLLSGGRRAAERGDAGGAINLLTRALDLLPPDHAERASLLVELSIQLQESGELERSALAIEEARSVLGSEPDPSVEFGLRFARLNLDMQTEPEGVAQRGSAEAERAIPRLEAIGDHAGLAKAWHLIGQSRLFWGDNAGMMEAFERSLDHAERAGDQRAAGEAVIWCLIGAVEGMTPASEGLPLVDALSARAPNDLGVSAWCQISRGRFLAMLGGTEEGRALVRSGRAIFRDLGRLLSIGGSSMPAAMLEAMAGDLEAAEREVRDGLDLLSSLGEKGYLSSAAGMAGRFAALRGHLDEAEDLVALAEETSATDDIYSQAWLRQALALVKSRRGDHVAAHELAEAAVRLAEGTDDCDVLSCAFEDLADIEREAGRVPEAAEAARRAVEVLRAKEAIVGAQRVLARFSDLTDP